MSLRWAIAALAILPVTGCVGPPPLPRDVLFNQPAQVGQPVFFLDHAGFASTVPGNSRLELYYQVYNFGLQFHKDTNDYVADYNFTVVVNDHDDNRVKVLEQTRKIHVPNYDKTLSRFDYRSSQFNLDLPPGKYELECTLKDLGNQATRDQTLKVDLSKFQQSYPTLSDIQFTQAAGESGGEKSVFVKDSLSIIPSVSRLFGGDDSSKLLFYQEVYPGDGKPEATYLETILRSDTKGMVYRDTLYVDLNSPVLRQLKDIPIDEYSPGDYYLEVYLRGRRAKLYDQRIEEFTIQWSQDRMLKHDFKTAVQQLELIASSTEIAKLKDLQTDSARIAAFNAFWEGRNTTAGIGRNLVKQEFYRRVTYANRQFRHLRREGWRTDRGRIYIKFGEPDQIDDFPMSPDALPYQIWHYYREGAYRRFTFVDENEDGDYRLQFPYDGLNQRPDF